MVVKFVTALAVWVLPAQLAVDIEHMLVHAYGYFHTISRDESPPKHHKTSTEEFGRE